MRRPRVLFQGSHAPERRPQDTPEGLAIATPIAEALGDSLIRAGFDLIITSTSDLSLAFGKSAARACEKLGLNSRDRVTAYPPDGRPCDPSIARVVAPVDRRYQEIRTFLITECDVVVALIGGKGTSDCVQKASLASKPVFPIAVAGGAARTEWERLRRSSREDRASLDFLADSGLSAAQMAEAVVDACQRELDANRGGFSRRIFVVHGHDHALKSEVARLLEKLDLVPVILAEQAERGRSLIDKLRSELADVGFAVILYTPDDVGAPKGGEGVARARQNVVFEHGLLLGLLGPDRIYVVVKGAPELPSDLGGMLTGRVPQGDSAQAVSVDLIRELKTAGYAIDANRLWS